MVERSFSRDPRRSKPVFAHVEVVGTPVRSGSRARGALVGCLLAWAAAASPAAAQRPDGGPDELWREYPLTQAVEKPPARPRADASRTGNAASSDASGGTSQAPWLVAGGIVLAVVLMGGTLALVRVTPATPGLRSAVRVGRRQGPAGAAPPPEPTRPARPEPADPPAPPIARSVAMAPRLSTGCPPPCPFKTCWVVCWRDARQACFYAVARDPAGHQHVIGQSPAFQPQDGPFLLDDASLESLRSLAERLARDGWEATSPIGSRGAAWHACEFHRKSVVASDQRRVRRARGHRAGP